MVPRPLRTHEAPMYRSMQQHVRGDQKLTCSTFDLRQLLITYVRCCRYDPHSQMQTFYRCPKLVLSWDPWQGQVHGRCSGERVRGRAKLQFPSVNMLRFLRARISAAAP